MDKSEILKKLKKFNLDKGKYLVISGAAMVLFEVKDTTKDIDIAVSKDYYEYLLNNYSCVFDRLNEFNHKCYNLDVLNFGIDYYSENYVVVEGVRVQTVEDIIKLKRFLNREKDKEDIKKLIKYKGE